MKPCRSCQSIYRIQIQICSKPTSSTASLGRGQGPFSKKRIESRSLTNPFNSTSAFNLLSLSTSNPTKSPLSTSRSYSQNHTREEQRRDSSNQESDNVITNPDPQDPLIDHIFLSFNPSTNSNISDQSSSFNSNPSKGRSTRRGASSSISVDRIRTLTSQWEGTPPNTSPIPSLLNLFKSNSKRKKLNVGNSEGRDKMESTALNALLKGDFKTLSILHDEELAHLGNLVAKNGWVGALEKLLKGLENHREVEGERIERGNAKGKEKEKLNQEENREEWIEFRLNCSPKGSKRRKLLLKEIWRGLLDSNSHSSLLTSTSSSTSTLDSQSSSASLFASSNANTDQDQLLAQSALNNSPYSRDTFLKIFNLLLEEENFKEAQRRSTSSLLGFTQKSVNRPEGEESESLFGNQLSFNRALEIMNYFLKEREGIEEKRDVFVDVEEISKKKKESSHGSEQDLYHRKGVEEDIIFHCIRHLEIKFEQYERRTEIRENLGTSNESNKESTSSEDPEIQNWSKDFLKASETIRFLFERNHSLNQTEDWFWMKEDSQLQEANLDPLLQVLDPSPLDLENQEMKNSIISILRRLASSSTSTSSISTISKESLRQGKEVGRNWLNFELNKRDKLGLDNDVEVRKRLKLESFKLSVLSILNRGCLRVAIGSGSQENDLSSYLKESIRLLKVMIGSSEKIKKNLEIQSEHQRLRIGEISLLNNTFNKNLDFFESNFFLKNEFILSLRLILNSPNDRIYSFDSVDDLLKDEEKLKELREGNSICLFVEVLNHLSKYQSRFVRDCLKGLSRNPNSEIGDHQVDQISREFKSLINSLVEESFAMRKRFQFKFNSLVPKSRPASNSSKRRNQTQFQNSKREKIKSFLRDLGPELALTAVSSIIKSSSFSARSNQEEVEGMAPLISEASNHNQNTNLSALDVLEPQNLIDLVQYLSKSDEGNGRRLKRLISKDLIGIDEKGDQLIRPSRHIYGLSWQLKSRLLIELSKSNLVSESILLYKCFFLQSLSYDPNFNFLSGNVESLSAIEIDRVFEAVIKKLGFASTDLKSGNEEMEQEEKDFTKRKTQAMKNDHTIVPLDLKVFTSNSNLLLQMTKSLKRYQSHPVYPNETSSTERLLQDLSKQTALSFSNLLFRLFINSGRIFTMTHYDLTSFARTCFVSQKDELAFKCFQELLQRKIIPDEKDLGVLIGGLMDSDDGKRQDSVVNLFLGETQDINGKASIGEGKASSSTTIDDLQEQQDRLRPSPDVEQTSRLIKPTPFLYNIILSSLLKTSSFDLIDKVVEDCNKFGMSEKLNVENKGLLLASSLTDSATLTVRVLDSANKPKGIFVDGLVLNVDFDESSTKGYQDQVNFDANSSGVNVVVEPRLMAWIMRCSALNQSPRFASECKVSHQDSSAKARLKSEKVKNSIDSTSSASILSSSATRSTANSLISSLKLHTFLYDQFSQVHLSETKVILNRILKLVKDFSKVFFKNQRNFKTFESDSSEVMGARLSDVIEEEMTSDEVKEFNERCQAEIKSRWIDRMDRLVQEIRWADEIVVGDNGSFKRTKAVDEDSQVSESTSKEQVMEERKSKKDFFPNSISSNLFQLIIQIYFKLGDERGVQETIAWMMQDGIYLDESSTLARNAKGLRIEKARKILEELRLNGRKSKRLIWWAFEVEKKSILENLSVKIGSESGKGEEARGKTIGSMILKKGQRVQRTKIWWGRKKEGE